MKRFRFFFTKMRNVIIKFFYLLFFDNIIPYRNVVFQLQPNHDLHVNKSSYLSIITHTCGYVSVATGLASLLDYQEIKLLAQPLLIKVLSY